MESKKLKRAKRRFEQSFDFLLPFHYEIEAITKNSITVSFDYISIFEMIEAKIRANECVVDKLYIEGEIGDLRVYIQWKWTSINRGLIIRRYDIY